jgi:putative spermidine/putrescine transport system permease protein
VVFIYLGLADTFLGVILVHLIYALPYTVNIMTDVTAMTGNGLELQSQVLGVSPVKSFCHITLPLIMPGMVSSASMAYIISFSQYFTTLMIGGGRVKTLSIVMVPFIQGGDRTIAASYALLFVLSTLAVFILLELLIKKFTARLSGV